MSSKTYRRKVRAERRRKRVNTGTALDPHAEVVVQSLADMLDGISLFAKSDDPVAAIDAALVGLVDELTARFCNLDPVRVIESARLACLPWSHGGGPVHAGSQKGPTQLELIALTAITAAQSGVGPADPNGDTRSQDVLLGESDAGGARPEREQKRELDRITEAVNEALPLINRILELGQLREMAKADHQDPLAMIAAMVRGSEVWIRSTSYPDMVSQTLIDLFNEPDISASLRSDSRIRRPGRSRCAE